jgi:hypothetical protein
MFTRQSLSQIAALVATLTVASAFAQNPISTVSPDACKKENVASFAEAKKDIDALKLSASAQSSIMERLASLAKENSDIKIAPECTKIKMKLSDLLKSAKIEAEKEARTNDKGGSTTGSMPSKPQTTTSQPPATGSDAAEIKACNARLPALQSALDAAMRGKNFDGDMQWMQRTGAIKAAKLGIGKTELQKCTDTERALKSATAYAEKK